MTRNVCRFLQPSFCSRFTPTIAPEHACAYVSVQRRFATAPSPPSSTHDHEKRLKQLQTAGELRDYHPRLALRDGVRRITPEAFNREFSDTQSAREDVILEVFGRVRSLRSAGPKLIFLDLERQDGTVQALCNFRLLAENGVTVEEFKRVKSILRKGDWFSVTGHPYRNQSGDLTIRATELPRPLAPSLHQIPTEIEDAETLARQPHVDSLVHKEARDIIRLKHYIKHTLQSFLIEDGFIDVETPMFDIGAGGAIARPFKTRANELSNIPLKLRIAPELSLKRLVVAGHEKIFEIGRVFRNEGVDNTHNPEFTICEFYEVGATLEDLIEKTERLFQRLASQVQALRASSFTSLAAPIEDFRAPFMRLPFIPTIEKAVSRPLPDLSTPGAVENLRQLFVELEIPLPTNPNLPRLLETLAEVYIEPLCTTPTFITHHPEILSPLSKSFVDPQTSQRVAARVELFIQGREYVNAYEEENSPFEQRRKFEEQLKYQEEEMGAGKGVDESYLEALEWGMPPTGGWGCGVDRLVMLFSGARRIADVLPFGTLRNVVAIAQNGRR